MFINNGRPFPVIISSRISGSGEGKDLRYFIEKELKPDPNFLPR
jgi:hypothetical protein